jgi:2-polyprenyl-3-methyl-5-hydroxy-6-metoxy-1,4-benzoquinol methylase
MPDNPNVNNSFFKGQYKELWRQYIPDELTRKELEFIFQFFKLQPGQEVLDIMCGYGRHAIGMARKGVQVTAVDNLEEYVDEIRQIALSENLPLQPIQSDILDYQATGRYDLAICMGNSLNFFNEKDSVKLMTAIAAGLKPNGFFLINTWSLAETVIKNFTDKSWSYNGDVKVLNESEYLFNPTRIETEFTFVGREGVAEVKKAVDYIFSYSEMQKMLEISGFEIIEAYSIPGKKTFAVGEPRAYIIAQAH